MIRFTCPGCRFPHLANTAFVGYRARCARCGVQLAVPEKSTVAAPTGNPAAAPRPEAKPDPEVFALADPAAPGSRSPKTRRPAPAPPPEEPVPDEDDGSLEIIENEPPTRPPADDRPARRADPEPEPDPPVSAGERAAKRKRVLLIAAPAVVVVAGAAYFFLSGGKPKETATTTTPAPVSTVEPPAPPAPPAPPPPVPVAAIAVAPPPHEPRPAEAYRMTATRFLRDYRDDPAGCDRRLAGQVVEVRGVCSGATPAAVTVGDGREAGDGNDGVACGLAAPPPALRPGQAVAVRGTYADDRRLTSGVVVSAAAPGDAAYLDRRVHLTGTVGAVGGADESSALPTLTFEPATTDPRVTVRCAFRQTRGEQLAKLKPGQAVAVRGVCRGRAFGTVRVEDCDLAGADEPPADTVRVAADRLAADYEADLLPAPRPDPPADPPSLTAEQLAAAFEADPRPAAATYRDKWVEVRGQVLARAPATRTVTFETGTSQKFRVVVALTPARYAALPPEATLTVRGVCAGAAGAVVRLENAGVPDPGATAGRTDAEYLPFRPGAEMVYDFLQPTRGKDHPIRRVSVRFAGTDQLRSAVVKAGTYPGDTLFGDRPAPPKWTRDLAKLKSPETVSQYRVRGDAVEVNHPTPTPQGQVVPFWEPVLKTGLRADATWAAESPDGTRLTYTVRAFTRDAAGRSVVEILRVSEHPKAAAAREEATIAYARGVGEVRRVTRATSPGGLLVVVGEMRLVEGADAAPKP